MFLIMYPLTLTKYKTVKLQLVHRRPWTLVISRPEGPLSANVPHTHEAISDLRDMVTNHSYSRCNVFIAILVVLTRSIGMFGWTTSIV